VRSASGRRAGQLCGGGGPAQAAPSPRFAACQRVALQPERSTHVRLCLRRRAVPLRRHRVIGMDAGRRPLIDLGTAARSLPRASEACSISRPAVGECDAPVRRPGGRDRLSPGVASPRFAPAPRLIRRKTAGGSETTHEGCLKRVSARRVNNRSHARRRVAALGRRVACRAHRDGLAGRLLVTRPAGPDCRPLTALCTVTSNVDSLHPASHGGNFYIRGRAVDDHLVSTNSSGAGAPTCSRSFRRHQRPRTSSR